MQRTTNQERHGAKGVAPRLHRQIYDILEDRIRGGLLDADAKLHEAHLASAFGVSRAPVRQALAELAEAGLVAKDGAQGFRVVTGLGATTARSGGGPAAPAPIGKLQAASSWQAIYARVEPAIAARMAVGRWQINESEMARFHDVSRTIVREVLARLQERGLVRKDGRSRWFAPALTPGYVAELYQMRWILEPVALLDALPQVPPGQLRDLRANLRAAIDRADQLNGADLDRLETEMHVHLLAGCRNTSLAAAIRLYQSLLVAHTFLYDRLPRLFAAEPFLPEHLAVADRLCAGHFEEAAERLGEHLRASNDRATLRIRHVAASTDIDGLLEEAPYISRMD